MKLLMTGTFPFSSAIDFATKSLEESISGIESDVKARTTYLKFGDEGLIINAILDIEKDKVEDALMQVQARAVRFGIAVNGMKWRVEPIFSVEEALNMLSQEQPPD